ncbi:MAG: hypothetical protein HC828_21240, partial [Blastochloris sp.]|nr:hypothetical protein [Blastochloris sp.]
MDVFSLLIIVGVLAYFGVVVYVANQEDAAQRQSTGFRLMLYSILALVFLFGLAVLQFGFLSQMELPADLQESLPAEVSSSAAGVLFAVTTALCIISFWVVSSERARMVLRRAFIGGAFNPQSNVHVTAWVLAVAVFVYTFGTFVLSGGIAGLAESFAEQSVSLSDVLLNQVLYVVFALLGVGLLIRRSGAESAERLGLRTPEVTRLHR